MIKTFEQPQISTNFHKKEAPEAPETPETPETLNMLKASNILSMNSLQK